GQHLRQGRGALGALAKDGKFGSEVVVPIHPVKNRSDVARKRGGVYRKLAARSEPGCGKIDRRLTRRHAPLRSGPFELCLAVDKELLGIQGNLFSRSHVKNRLEVRQSSESRGRRVQERE